MKHEHCVVCGTENDLQQHHIDPVVYGKSKRTKKKNMCLGKNFLIYPL